MRISRVMNRLPQFSNEVFIVGSAHGGAHRCGTVVFRPLVFNPNQHPLPAVKFEMLQTGELEKALFRIDQPSRAQATPAGRAASSTVMV